MPAARTLTLLVCPGEPDGDRAGHRQHVAAPDGIGTLASYATEVALPVKGTWKNPVIGSARADIVLTAPEAGVPLLFIEVEHRGSRPDRQEVRQVRPVLPAAGEGHRRHREAAVAHPLVRAPFRGVRAGAPAGPARLAPGRPALRQEPDGEGRRPHPPPLAGAMASRGRLPLQTDVTEHVSRPIWRPPGVPW